MSAHQQGSEQADAVPWRPLEQALPSAEWKRLGLESGASRDPDRARELQRMLELVEMQMLDIFGGGVC